MARTNLPTTALVANSGVLNPTATAVDQANGMNILLPSTAIPRTADADHLVLVVANTAAAAHNVIVRAGAGEPGAYGPAFRTGKGDLTFSVTNAQTAYVGPFEVARFAQADGSLNIDFDTGFTGTVLALLMPVTVN